MKIFRTALTLQVLMAATSIAWAAEKAGSASGSSAIMMAILMVLAIYFVPTIIGFIRKKDNKIAILMLNLFLGWSLIGWVIALIWAVSKDKVTVQNVYVNQVNEAPSA